MSQQHNRLWGHFYTEMKRIAAGQIEQQTAGIFASGKVLASSITGALPSGSILHAMQSIVHTDADHSTTPKDGDVWGFTLARNQWGPRPAGLSDPTSAAGDLIIRSLANALARLAIGTEGQVLTVAGGVPAWANPTGGGTTVELLVAGDPPEPVTASDGDFVYARR